MLKLISSFSILILLSAVALFWLSLLTPSVSYRVIEMPYAYQCCVYGSCDNYKPTSQWDTEQSNTDEDLHKRTVAMYPIHADTHCKKTHNISHNIQTWPMYGVWSKIMRQA